LDGYQLKEDAYCLKETGQGIPYHLYTLVHIMPELREIQAPERSLQKDVVGVTSIGKRQLTYPVWQDK
jgi:hypothetical protein